MSISSAASQATVSSVAPWQMPILAENYPYRDPFVPDEEAALMEHYATTPANTMTGVSARKVLGQLQRFDKPFLDTLLLRAKPEKPIAKSRRHLFKYMAQTRRVFWSWSEETWVEVIQTAPGGGQQNAGPRFWMIALAYLFSDFLYVGAFTPYIQLADTIFGKDIVDAEVDKLHGPLIALGYSQHPEEQRRFRRLCAMVMLANRSPYAEALSAPVLVLVNDLLASIPDATRTRGRQDIMRLQASLCHLGILDEPVTLVSTKEKALAPSALWQNDSSVDPTWLAWVCAYYDQTPHLHEKTIRQTCYALLAAGRWLKKVHPEISEPAQWDEALALEYVTYTCQTVCGDQMLPSHSSYAKFQETPQKLSPSTISKRIAAMRVFFSHLQRRPYTVQGKRYPKLQLGWLSREAFKTPDDINAACQPNPRDIQEDIWFKLIWAACTLTKEQLGAAGNFWYPLAYYRQVSASFTVWTTTPLQRAE